MYFSQVWVLWLINKVKKNPQKTDENLDPL